jgi:GNAT superfamily N-acetyltransferase
MIFKYRRYHPSMLEAIMITISQAGSASDLEEARALFREYESWLGLDLCFQGFEQELRELPGKYAPPAGRLLLAFDDGRPAGCIALRQLEDGVCEMKRLYVRDEFRGKRIGLDLIERLMTEARDAGYKIMRLDTFPPKMPKAVELYESHGFRPIPPYYDNPHDGVLFMECSLEPATS